MVGGTIFGYCSMGNPMREIPPNRTITIEITIAMVGCLMKKEDISVNQQVTAEVKLIRM
jgi:hypothetical protein